MTAYINDRLIDKSTEDPLKPIRIIILVLVVVLAVAIIYTLALRVNREKILFDTDEASHATPALELYVAMQRKDIDHFIRAILDQSFYPPVHSFTVLASYLIAGPSLASSRMPSVISLAILSIALAIISYRIIQTKVVESSIAIVAAAVTIYLVVTSPTLIMNSVLSMLELTGCVMCMLLLWVCCQIDQPHIGQWIRVFSLSLILLLIMLTKYTFGLFAIPAVGMALVIRTKTYKIKKPQLVEVVEVFALLSVLLAIWFISAGPGGILRFMFNQPQYASLFSLENIFYYPHVWVSDYHLNPVLGFITALLAIYGVMKGWKHFVNRTAFWVIIFSLIFLTISLNNQPRHFAFAAPCVWFLAAQGLGYVMSNLIKLPYTKRFHKAMIMVLIALLGMIVWHRSSELHPMLTDAFEGLKGDRNLAMQSYILENVSFEENILIFGMFDQLNHEALQWQVAVASGKAPSEILFDMWPRIIQDIEQIQPDYSSENWYEATLLKAAATQGHYRQMVVLHHNDSTDPYVIAAPTTLNNFLSTSKVFEDFRIDIFNFEN
jgi:hypothetical protein